MAKRQRNISDKFHDALINHAVNVIRFSETVREQITVSLYDLGNELAAKILDASPSTKLGAAFVTKKLETLINSAKNAITKAYADNADLLNSNLRELAKLENEFYPRLINGVIGADVAKIPMTITETKALADNSIILGGPANEWWDKQDRKLQDQFATEMRIGYGQGEGIDELVTRVRGDATGRIRKLIAPDGESVDVSEYSGGIMEASRRDATALVRTSIQNVSNQTLANTYAENSDVVGGVVFVATLDGRTCQRCAAYDLCAWDQDGNPTDDSANPKLLYIVPPIHFSCRCILAPKTRSWAELIKNSGGEVPPGFEEVDTATRASMDGQVSASMSYEDWLQTQSESTQQNVLGDQRWQLWKDGKVTLGDMVDQSGRALSLDDLKQSS